MARTPAPAAPAVDSFQRSAVSGPMDASALRRLAATQHVRPAVTPIDIKKIPFGVEIEAEGFDPNKARPVITSLPEWNVNPKVTGWEVVPDGSLASGGEAVSPVMTLEGGEARRQIKAVLDTMNGLGAQFTSRCGLHIHVDARSLGKAGMSRLMRIAMENENLMYRLSQNGRPQHRGTIPDLGMKNGVPYAYSKPMSAVVPDPFPLLHADSSGEFRNAYYGQIPNNDPKHPRPPLPPPEVETFHPDRRDPARYLGFNFNSYWYRGTIEFRLFDPTNDPDQIMADVEMVLGLVKAAAEDTYVYLKPDPVDGQAAAKPVSREGLNYFLSQVAPDPSLQQRLLSTFERSGGKIKEDAPVTDPAVLDVATLMGGGHRFTSAGKLIESPLEVADEIRARRRPVACIGPDGTQRPVGDTSHLQPMVSADALARLGPQGQARMRAALGVLVRAGHNFAYQAVPADSRILDASRLPRLNTDADVALSLQRGGLVAFPGAAATEGMRIDNLEQLEQYARVETSPLNELKPDVAAALSTAARMASAGVAPGVVYGNQFAPLRSRAAFLEGLRSGHVVLPLAGNASGYMAVRSLADLQQASNIVLNDTAHLPPSLAPDVSRLAGLESRGVEWTSFAPGSSQPETLNRLGQLDRLRRGTLVAHLATPMPAAVGAASYVAVADSTQLRTLDSKIVKSA